MKIERRRFHAANYLNGPEDQADLLSNALADGDPRYIAAALGYVARSLRGISELAHNTGLHRKMLERQ